MCLQANIGQEEDFDAARKKAENLGAKKVIGEIWDLNEQVNMHALNWIYWILSNSLITCWSYQNSACHLWYVSLCGIMF